MEIISSKNNPLIKEICSLEQKKYREKLGIFFVEGEKSVRESLELAPKSVRRFIVAEAKLNDFEFLVGVDEKKVLVVTNDIFNHISNTNSPQGIACILEIPKSNNFSFDKPFLVLDHIQDPGNLGTIIRSALATNFLDIFLIDCVDPFSNKVVRSSASSIFSINLIKIKREDFVALVKTKGAKLIVAEAGRRSIFDKTITLPKCFGLVVGSEGEGVSEDILKLEHMSVSLPMNEKIESLNAAVSASIIMYILTNR